MIKAKRAVVKFDESGLITVDGYLLPSGELRIGLASASVSSGFEESWLSQVIRKETSTLLELQSYGFTGEITEVTFVRSGKPRPGASKVKTISKQDFLAIVHYAVAQGKVDSLCFLTKKPVGATKVKTKKMLEDAVKNKLALHLNGTTEVRTPVGDIDVLTSDSLIEVKRLCGWKSALGQVLAYADYYPSHQPVIHVIGSAHSLVRENIERICAKFNVRVQWEDKPERNLTELATTVLFTKSSGTGTTKP